MKLSTIALRNVFRNKRRSILCMVAIGVAAMSIVLLFSLLAGMKADMRGNIVNFFTGEIRIRHNEYGKYERLNPLHLRVDNYKELINNIENINDITGVSPRINFPTAIFIGEEQYGAQGIGMDFEREQNYQDFSKIDISGRLPENGNSETIIGSGLAEELNIGVGDKFTILSQTMRRATNAITLEVVGIAHFPVAMMNEKNFLVPIGTAQYFLRMDNAVTELLIKHRADSNNELENQAAQIEHLASEMGYNNLEVKSLNQINTTYSFMVIAEQIYNVIAIFFFVLGSTVVITTTMMVIYERMREIGTIAALGMTNQEITRLFFYESLYISIIGSALGCTIGIVFTLILNYTGIDLTAAMEGVDMEISGMIFPQLNLKSTIGVFFFSVIVASLTTFVPSRKAAKVEPVEALRTI